MTDIEINKIIEKLRKCGKSSYYVAQKTGLSNSTLSNWLTGKTKPTPANIAILERFLCEEEIGDNNKCDEISDSVQKITHNSGVVVTGRNTVGDIDNRQYHAPSPDAILQEDARPEKDNAAKDILIGQQKELIEQQKELIDQQKTLINQLMETAKTR